MVVLTRMAWGRPGRKFGPPTDAFRAGLHADGRLDEFLAKRREFDPVWKALEQYSSDCIFHGLSIGG